MQTIFQIARSEFGSRLKTPELTDEIRRSVIRARQLLNEGGLHWGQSRWVGVRGPAYDPSAPEEYNEYSDFKIEITDWPVRHDPENGMLYQDKYAIEEMCVMGGFERAAWEAMGKPDMSQDRNVLMQSRLVLNCAVWISQFIEIHEDDVESYRETIRRDRKGVGATKKAVENAVMHWNDEGERTWEDIDDVLKRAVA